MWQWVKACKGAALVAFFLPWMTVSCSGTELIRASGWDLAIGRPKLSPALAEMAQGAASAQQAGGGVSVWLILTLAAIIAGLVFAFRPVASGAKLVVASSIAGIVLLLIGTRNLSGEAMTKAMAARGAGSNLDTMAAAAIRIDWQIGYWLTLLTLAAAAVLSWMALTGRRFGGGVAVPPPA